MYMLLGVPLDQSNEIPPARRDAGRRIFLLRVKPTERESPLGE